MITKTVVSGNLGRFVQGQVLETREDIAEYYRLSVSEGAATPCTATDAQILAVIDEVDVSSIADGSDDADSDIDVVRTEALEKALDLVSNEGLESDHAE